MSLPFVGLHVTVHRAPFHPTGPDRRGHREPSWGQPEPVHGCLLAPGGGTEPAEAGRDKVTTTATLYAPPGTVIGPRDRVITPDGTTWDVDGPAQHWPTSLGPGGVVAVLTRTTG